MKHTFVKGRLSVKNKNIFVSTSEPHMEDYPYGINRQLNSIQIAKLSYTDLVKNIF